MVTLNPFQKVNKGEARKSRWRVLAGKAGLYIYLVFCAYQLFCAVRYGAVLPFARHHPGGPWYVYYNDQKGWFVYSLIMWELPLLLGSLAFVPISVVMRTPWEKAIVRKKVSQELAQTRPRFEDESKIEPYQSVGSSAPDKKYK